MIGVFGAGVVTSLQKANIYNRIQSVYGISAGSHDVAYFLSEDALKGSSIYYEDLTNGNFIKKDKFLKFLWSFFLKIFDRNRKVENIMDIDYLIDVEKTRKKLDIEKIKKQPINFFVKVFDLERSEAVYINAKENVFQKLKASSSAQPFYQGITEIDGRIYIDSSVISDLIDDKLMELAESNKDKKIICVFNHPVNSMLNIGSFFGNLLWGLFIWIQFRSFSVFWKKINLFKRYKRIKKFLEKENVFCIQPQTKISIFCDDREKLLELYKEGIKKTDNFLKDFV